MAVFRWPYTLILILFGMYRILISFYNRFFHKTSNNVDIISVVSKFPTDIFIKKTIRFIFSHKSTTEDLHK